MEIGSMDSMADMMGMQGIGGPPPKPDASEMSSKFMDALDSDGDGLLSETELSVDGNSDSTSSTEVFDALDTNEDGFVSQDELEADMTSQLGQMKAKLESGAIGGIKQNGDSEGLQQLMDMMGGSSADRARGAEMYERMQGGTFGGGVPESTLSSGLSVSA